MRIITLLAEGRIQVAAALQRFGMDKSKCVDSAHAGGLYSEIDLETGVMTAARSRNKEWTYSDGSMKLFPQHPTTNAQIEGRRVPNWNNLCRQVEELHRKLMFTGIDFVAWDIALTEDGFKVIEGNTSCTMLFLQPFHGARKGIVGTWMREKGYIK